MQKNIADRLAIGCAQFGLPYGITNKVGQVDPIDVSCILEYAKHVKITTLDTAISYGESEAVLGRIGIGGWSVISKLPPLPKERIDVHSWVLEQVNDSLNRLNISSLDGLLLHHPNDLLGELGRELVDSLDFLRSSGIVKKIGISIYQPQLLERFFNVLSPEIVQCPFNVLDHRLLNSGWAEKLNKMNVEVHVRSIFLQGLLLVEKSERSPFFDKWRPTWDRWDLMLKNNNLSPIRACLNEVIFNELFHKIIIGINELRQLMEIVDCCNLGKVAVKEDISVEDVNLLHPFNWA